MAYQALYRKYRPKTFSDVVGQDHITGTLKNELATGRTVHAYLFTGSRGTGKTSCAKILAKAVNCLNPINGDPCLQCDACLTSENGENTDIVEIDAASNNSVDSIRELREQVNFAPACSKYRVYIIDEVHMLSISAFNALLKTLEEPPQHVIFILATTEVHKLPATILSRCQRFDFRRIDTDIICSRLKYVAEKEGFSITDQAAMLIASASDGGMRDALSLLDLCSSGNDKIDEKIVEDTCGMARKEYLFQICDNIKNGNTESALLLIDKLHNSSVDMQRLVTELIGHYRNLMIVKTVKSGKRPIVCSTEMMKMLENQAMQYDIKEIMTCLSVLQNTVSTMQSGNRRCEVEMAIIKMCNPSYSYDISSLEKRISVIENKLSVINTDSHKSFSETSISKNYNSNENIKNVELEESSDSLKTINNDSLIKVEEWIDILKELKKTSPLMAGVLQGSGAYIKNEYLLIDAPNSQFRSLINSGNPFYKDSIRKAALQILGKTYKLGPYNPSSSTEKTDPLSDLAEKLKKFDLN